MSTGFGDALRKSAIMKTKIRLAVVLSALSLAAITANAGPGKGGVIGSGVGHVVGKHAVAGATAGCAIGHHSAKKKPAATLSAAVPADNAGTTKK